MSIAVTATEKFDFQDLVCVEMMLRFHRFAGTQFLVEPQGGEDGELLLGADPVRMRAHIQVKGAAGTVELATIAECLAHFPPRKSSDTLLERLMADPNSLVVLVMSGRCDDAASIYTAPHNWSGAHHAVDTIKTADAKALLSAFSEAKLPGKAGGKLKTKRQAHCRAKAIEIRSSALRGALRRLVVLERVNEPELETRCGEFLRSDQRIPSDRIPIVLDRLRTAVKTAKINGVDAFGLVRSVLKEAAPPSVRPPGYILRGREAEWTVDLSRDGVLLLSGPPRVGKTDAARWVAAEFEPNGYEIRETNEVAAAERYLLEPNDDSRLVILDDPLGGTHSVVDPVRALSRLAELIPTLRTNRRLIVAQTQEHLLSVTRKATLSDAVTAGHNWWDLGSVTSDFLVGLWQQLAQDCDVAEPLRETVRQALEKGDLELEAGCLVHLATQQADLGGDQDLDRIVRVARNDAVSLGYALAEVGFRSLLTACAIASSVSEPIALPELAYVNGVGGNSLPGKPKGIEELVGSGYCDSKDTALPDYDTPPRLPPEDQDRIDILEQRRMIEVDAQESLSFIHPFYRAAAEAVLDGHTRKTAATATTVVERGLFCRMPATSRATARNLEWVFEKLTPRLEAQIALVDHAIAGLNSFFPSTRDLCFRFLIRRLPQLPHDRQTELPNWISSVTSVRLDSLEWIDGEARLPIGRSLGHSIWDRVFAKIAQEDVKTEVSILEADGGYLSPERAAKVLSFYKNVPTAISIRGIRRLLSYDEATIRAEAAELWLKLPRSEDDDVLRRIFADDHPSNALAALKGAIMGWQHWSTARRHSVLESLKELAGSPATAAAMLDRLVLFGRVEYTGESTPWPIFEALLPLVMRVLPANAAFADDRLFGVARTALSVLAAPSITAICDGWIEWLERNAAEGSLPSEFSLGVTDIVLSATTEAPDLRNGRVQRLLALPGTGAILTFIADLVDHWEDLTEAERLILEETIAGQRSDNRWLQAVVLTRSNVPRRLQQRILGNSLLLESGPEEILSRMEPQLLVAAVHVYSGWCLSLNFSGLDRWPPI